MGWLWCERDRGDGGRPVDKNWWARAGLPFGMVFIQWLIGGEKKDITVMWGFLVRNDRPNDFPTNHRRTRADWEIRNGAYMASSRRVLPYIKEYVFVRRHNGVLICRTPVVTCSGRIVTVNITIFITSGSQGYRFNLNMPYEYVERNKCGFRLESHRENTYQSISWHGKKLLIWRPFYFFADVLLLT